MSFEEIRKKHNLCLILMHGSQVTGKIHTKSDTDIAVMQKNDKKKLDILDLYGDFAKTLKTDNVDIVDLTHANPLLSFTVARRSKLLAGSKADYETFLRTAFYKYNDYRPYLKKEAKFIKEKVRSYVSS